MRLHLLLLFALVFTAGCRESSLKEVISNQIQDYPESRVQDIYKSFCQDNLGPEHLIPDTAAARKYLEKELAAFREDLDSLRYGSPQRRYYPVGDRGNYIRVDLSVVLDSLVSETALLDAFVRSANEGRKVSPEEWVAKWRVIAGIIRKDFKDIPGSEQDLAQLDSLIRNGYLIMHHSPEFGAAYHPHYRIIAKDIFEAELKPLIDP